MEKTFDKAFELSLDDLPNAPRLRFSHRRYRFCRARHLRAGVDRRLLPGEIIEEIVADYRVRLDGLRSLVEYVEIDQMVRDTSIYLSAVMKLAGHVTCRLIVH